jgi:aminopeptidase N
MNRNATITITCCLLFAISVAQAQRRSYIITKDDTLRGSLTPVRTCFDVTYYDLSVRLDVKRHVINGNTLIRYEVVENFDSIQIDLTARMKIEKILFQGTELSYRRLFNSVFIKFPETQTNGNVGEITVIYSGVPVTAKNAPWDGGFSWKKDAEGREWIGVTCEGIGPSVWWPCKDHLSDEPDSMRMRFTVPTGLVCVSNGTLLDTVNAGDGNTSWTWFVSYPINLYNVTLNLAHYAFFSDTFRSEKQILPLHYYVLDYNLAQARLQFQQVKTMLGCFEKYFGPYPFIRDGYKLVETPYYGMEHQSAIAYGNDYINNKNGFDYIIIHESAHEWWGNHVSASDYADLWIHEGFATYAEALYLECTRSAADAAEYMKNMRWQIRDSFAVVGPRGVNFDGTRLDGDMYPKGAWIIHTFRSVLNDDSLFFKIILGLQNEFGLKAIATEDVVNYINRITGENYSPFFEQYLRHPSPPVLEYKTRQKGKNLQVTYRWKTQVDHFEMPAEVTTSYSYLFGKEIKLFTRINATSEWHTMTIQNFEAKDFNVNADKFYVKKNFVK